MKQAYSLIPLLFLGFANLSFSTEERMAVKQRETPTNFTDTTLFFENYRLVHKRDFRSDGKLKSQRSYFIDYKGIGLKTVRTVFRKDGSRKYKVVHGDEHQILNYQRFDRLDKLVLNKEYQYDEYGVLMYLSITKNGRTRVLNMQDLWCPETSE